MASRTLYKNSGGTVIGAGPQTYVAPPQVGSIPFSE